MATLLLLRLNELDADVRPADALGALGDLGKTGAAMPAIVDAALGRGRLFASVDADGLKAQDVTSGATLLTRDATIQAVIAWDIATAAAYGAPQTIYSRGLGTAAAEYVGAGIELRVVNAALRIGEVRWIWQDLAGVLRTQIGGHFQVPADGFLMLTATRRWISSSRVVLRYYLGDALLSEVESADGEIAGGTTGTTTIGTRYTGAAYGRHLDGVIDELRVVDEELTAEEVAATWRRITIEQPRGYALLRELHDPGFPISQDPASRAQRETRMWGHGLGFAAAQAENVRANLLPDRAYGEALARWEAIAKPAPAPKAGDDVDTRRRRVIGKIRQRRGVSIPGIGDALAGAASLLDTDADELEVVAYDQTVRETFDDATTIARRWHFQPALGAGWSHSGVTVNASSDFGTVRDAFTDWMTGLVAIGGRGRAAEVVGAIDIDTLDPGGEFGILLLDRVGWNGVLVGLRNDAGAGQIVTETLRDGVLEGLAVRGVVPLGATTLHLKRHDQTEADPAGVTFTARWHQGGAWSSSGSFVSTVNVAHGLRWAGIYVRSFGGAAAEQIAIFEDFAVRAPYGDRAFRFYVYRDPALAGAPDIDGARNVIRGLRQAHTAGDVVTTLTTLHDDPDTPHDHAPTGGI